MPIFNKKLLQVLLLGTSIMNSSFEQTMIMTCSIKSVTIFSNVTKLLNCYKSYVDIADFLVEKMLLLMYSLFQNKTNSLFQNKTKMPMSLARLNIKTVLC